MLGLSLSFGRLFRTGEQITTGKINAIVKGTSASLTGQASTSDIEDGAVTPAKTTPGAYFYATASYSSGTYAATYTPAISSYADGLVLAFKAGAANTGTASLDAGAGGKPLRKQGGTVLEAGDIASGMLVEVRYNTTLVAGGCWEITSQLKLTTNTQPIAYSFRDLTVCNSSSSPLTTLVIGSTNNGEIISQDVNGLTRRHIGPGGSVDITVLGAGGRDTGAEASSTWYYLWFIHNPTSNVSNYVLSTNDNWPTLPTNYTYAALIGAIYNDASSNLISIVQQDHEVFCAETTVFTGQAGTAAFTFSSLAAVVPPAIAKTVSGNMGTSTSAAWSMAVAGGAGMPSGITTPSAIGSNPVGVARGGSGNSALVLGGLYNATGWHVPISYNGGNPGVWSCMGDTVAKYALTVTGWSF